MFRGCSHYQVLEVGSYDVNGSIRPHVESVVASYVGVDQTAGPGVDKVVPAEDLVATFGAESFDVVVSCEMLEHAADWRTCMEQMATVTRDLLIVTTRSPGFPYHAYPEDWWRFTVDDMTAIYAALGFDGKVIPDPQAAGVFAVGSKIDIPGSLAGIDVAPAPQPRIRPRR